MAPKAKIGCIQIDFDTLERVGQPMAINDTGRFSGASCLQSFRETMARGGGAYVKDSEICSFVPYGELATTKNWTILEGDALHARLEYTLDAIKTNHIADKIEALDAMTKEVKNVYDCVEKIYDLDNTPIGREPIRYRE